MANFNAPTTDSAISFADQGSMLKGIFWSAVLLVFSFFALRSVVFFFIAFAEGDMSTAAPQAVGLCMSVVIALIGFMWARAHLWPNVYSLEALAWRDAAAIGYMSGTEDSDFAQTLADVPMSGLFSSLRTVDRARFPGRYIAINNAIYERYQRV